MTGRTMLAVLAFFACPAWGAALVTYDFNDGGLSPSAALGVVATSIQSGSGTSLYASPNPTPGLAPLVLGVGGWEASSYNEADSFTFSLSALPGNDIILSLISFDAAARPGLKTATVEMSLSGGPYVVVYDSSNLGDFLEHQAEISGIIGFGESASFRFSGLSRGRASPFYFDNIVIHGDTTPVPAPGAAILLLAGLLLAFRRRSSHGRAWPSSPTS